MSFSVFPTIRTGLLHPCDKVATRCVIFASLMVLAACGSDTATVATTVPPVVTTAAPATTDAPATTTTVAGMSRDATLALARCVDATGMFFAEQVTLDRGYLTDAIAACDEAALQVEVEAAPPGNLVLDIGMFNIELAYANYTIASDLWDVAAQDKLQTAVDGFTATYG